ncbi:MAG TPA: DNA recombination protein RmuC [Stellaceae bacterium]|nr:DNA recombination protein RmuC [Stellaceae bacterium]
MDSILIVLFVVLAACLVWLFLARDSALKAKAVAEQGLAVAQQRLAEAQARSGDFERLRQESLQSAQAAMLATARELNAQLLDSHKRENAEATKEAEARVTKASEQFSKQFESIVQKVSELSGQVQDKGKTLDTVMRALSSPGGAGALAEVGLANTLKSFGLESPRDFMLQFSTTDGDSGRRLRPDAVVFLPGDCVVVIDCKASKFLLGIAEAEGTEREAEAYRGLATTMNLHLKALASKDYSGAVLASFRDSGRGGEIARTLSIMYLPSEAALEKLLRADPEFMAKARDCRIIPAGPAGLHCAISLASVEIGLMRQAENQQQIVEATRALIDSLGIVLGHAATVGKGIKAAAESFAKLASSVNNRLLPRARKLGKLGLPGNKPLDNLPAYVVHNTESETIEGEVEEIETPAPAPSRPRLIGE